MYLPVPYQLTEVAVVVRHLPVAQHLLVGHRLGQHLPVKESTSGNYDICELSDALSTYCCDDAADCCTKVYDARTLKRQLAQGTNAD